MTQKSHYWTHILREPELKMICTPTFIVTLFTIARTWKQPRCPSADEWIKEVVVHIQNRILLSYKKNTFESVLMRWMNLEPIIRKRKTNTIY